MKKVLFFALLTITISIFTPKQISAQSCICFGPISGGGCTQVISDCGNSNYTAVCRNMNLCTPPNCDCVPKEQVNCGGIGESCCPNQKCNAEATPITTSQGCACVSQKPNTGPFPQIRLPCDEDREIEFHSLRPYQAAPCGEANKAYYCSNDLIFMESFDMAGKSDCGYRLSSPGEITFTCNPNYQVWPHDLYVSLDNSNLPILGNTEDVKNSQNQNELLSDAEKVNEYVSWYLSGVNTRAEYGEPSNDTVVNFSGPIQKLLPEAIANAQRIKVIEGVRKKDSQNHNQTVVCAEKTIQLLPSWLTNIFGLGSVGIGTAKTFPCYEKGVVYKLDRWDESPVEVAINEIKRFMSKILSINTFTAIMADAVFDRWSKKTPPLPWDDGTGKPFETADGYRKAYSEWRGDLCLFLPNPLGWKGKTLVCAGIPGVTNNIWADLFQYVPLAETPDKEGFQTIDSVEANGGESTKVEEFKHKPISDPPLYFAHTETVKQLSEILNTTYIPKGVSGQKMDDVEENFCSVVSVRSNKGDDLFPGDPEELQIRGVEYKIVETTCHETYKEEEYIDEFGFVQYNIERTLECPANVEIRIKTGTLTPNADEIFATTVADSMSTFRRIFPKVGDGSLISCIADIPAVTGITYNASKSQIPAGGSQSFSVKNIPEDGVGSSPQLTFPHLGSVYEYFLKGIQTALRPKGYGSLTTSGVMCKTSDSIINICDPNCNKNSTGLDLSEVQTKFIDLATRWCGSGGNPRIDLYDTVVNSAQLAGIDPIFVLAIWLNESGASNYACVAKQGSNYVLDFGINKEELKTTFDSEGNVINDNFIGQLQNFVNLPGFYYSSCNGNSTAKCPMEYFGSMFSIGQCNPTDGSNSYISGILDIYKWLKTGSQNPCYPSTLP